MIIPYESTLSAQGETVSKLLSTLELESNIAIDWKKILDRKKSILTYNPLTIDNQTIKPVPTVELLRIHLDDKLNINCKF